MYEGNMADEREYDLETHVARLEISLEMLMLGTIK
jgi:hypothetical protein